VTYFRLMSLAEIKEEILRLNPEELLEVEKLVRIQRVVTAPGWRERITRAQAEMDAGRKVTQEQLEAMLAERRSKKP
jgi:hypothetical protein